MTGRPLDGITVVSLEQAVAAPFASRQLADLGARVIKIERPGTGDFARQYDETVNGESSYFVWLNRSKESLTLDLKDEQGRAILQDLLSRADVFIQNLAPGATTRMGLDAATLATELSRLIVCDISGYGNTGPWADRKAYDMIVQAEAGLLSLTGTPETPSKVGISIADIAAGMYAYSGILAALIHRSSTGIATPVEVSLFEALSEWMGAPAYFTEYSGRSPSRVGAEHATIAPYGPFPTADGGVVVLAIQNEREWARFCSEFLGDPALTTDPRFIRNSARVANRRELSARVGETMITLQTADAVDALDRAQVANGRINTISDLITHPSLAGRNRWRDVVSPGGTIRALLPPANLAGVMPRMDPIPTVGEHTDSILAELGRTVGDIEKLRATGVV
jgi:crotonobetainyl-CoA:carnitine CoA-transferase CaiB-like acyl-CoA transferase